MYCKHCGKEIADDSKFCQHCGGKIDNSVSLDQESLEVDKKEQETNELDVPSNSNEWLKWGIIYAIYVVLNILLLISGWESSVSREYLWPFGNPQLLGHEPFNPTNYDFTDFLVYVFLIPLCVFGWIKFISNPNKEKKEGE